MDYKILLPTQVWQGYDPFEEELEEGVIAASERGNIKIKSYRINAISGECPLIATIKQYKKSNGNDDKVIMIVPEYHRMPSEEIIDDLAKSGFTVFVADIAGNSTPPTQFPEKYSYGKFSNAGDHIKMVMPSAKETSQYLYAIIVKRALYLVQKLLPDAKVALMGMYDSVEVAMQVAGSNTKVDALVCFNSAGYREYIRLNKYGGGNELQMTEERMAWLSGVASVAYAKYITCPVFITMGTNGTKSDIDRVPNFVSMIPNENFHLVFSPRAADYTLPGAYRTLKNWLIATLEESSFPDCPEARLRVNEEGKIYCDVDCDPSSMIKEVTIYYSYGEYNHRVREWLAVEGEAVSFNEYLAIIEVTDAEAPLFAFAEVLYENGIRLSSLPEYMELKGQTAKARPKVLSKIIYETSMELSDFTEIYRKEVLFERGITVAETPSGAKGVTSLLGALMTYRINRHFEGGAQTILQIELCSEEEKEFRVELKTGTGDEIKTYSAVDEISDTDGFFIARKFKLTDFKDDKFMPLSSWSKIHSVAIYAEDVIIGNILFI